MVRVGPEARLEPTQIALQFQVAESVVQTARVGAWVRSQPGQQIRVLARLAELRGPNGPVPVTAVTWTGAVAQSAAGGHQARCANGAFVAGQAQDLVLGWHNSGTLTCDIAFTVAAPGSLSPGVYSGTVDLALSVQ